MVAGSIFKSIDESHRECVTVDDMKDGTRDISLGRFFGLQALACTALGIVVSILVDHSPYRDVSTITGMILTVTLVLVVMGRALMHSWMLWAGILAVTMLNVILAHGLSPHRGFQPISAAPFLLIELIAFRVYTVRISKRS